MKQFIKNIDQFGVEKQLQIQPNEPVIKSLFGGVLTLILYGVSLGYFLSEFIDWTQNNKLPKITSFQKEIAISETVPLDGKFFEVSYYLLNETYIDPFDPDNLILYPMARKLEGSLANQQNINMQFAQIPLSNGQKQNSFYLKDQIMEGSPLSSSDGSFRDYIILFGFCNSSTIPESFKCANSSLITTFYTQINFFNMQFYTTQYNSKQKTLYNIPKTQKVQMIQNYTKFFQYSLQVSNLQADDGILFNNLKNYTFLSDFSLATQDFSQEYTFFVYHLEAAFMAYLTLDQIKQEIQVDYPKISEILADTGSIIAWIMCISIFAVKYNESKGFEQTIKSIIEIYYPDYQYVKIRKNIFGKFKSVAIYDQNYDPVKVQELMKSLNQIAEQKISFQNILFEISRLQFIMMESLGIDTMVRGMMIAGNFKELLDFQNQDNSIIVGRNDQKSEAKKFFYKLEETISLLSMGSKEQDQEMHIVPKETLQPENISIIQT